MKRIVEGRRYDTETATKVASWTNGLGGNDFRHTNESLYLTHNGNWFLEGCGGPMSDWKQATSDRGWRGSCGLRPVTAIDAQRWLEDHDLTDLLEEHFHASIEDA